MPVLDLEHELETRFVSTLRSVFATDNKFLYNKDDKQTKVLITTEYPDTETPWKTPQIIVTDIAWNFNAYQFIGNNFNRDVAVGKIVNAQTEFAASVPYSVTLLCMGIKYDSKDVANRLFNYISLINFADFNATGLNIVNIGKNPMVVATQFPEKVFQTPITVSGEFIWTGLIDVNGTVLQHDDIKLETQIK
jgi:hypothetical protein